MSFLLTTGATAGQATVVEIAVAFQPGAPQLPHDITLVNSPAGDHFVTVTDVTRFALTDPVSFPIGQAPSDIEQTFRALSERLARETAHESAEWRRTEHPAHEAIVALGWDVVPILLRQLQANQGRWFSALAEITGENPATGTRTYQDAARAWCDWGTRRGYL